MSSSDKSRKQYKLCWNWLRLESILHVDKTFATSGIFIHLGPGYSLECHQGSSNINNLSNEILICGADNPHNCTKVEHTICMFRFLNILVLIIMHKEMLDFHKYNKTPNMSKRDAATLALIEQ